MARVTLAAKNVALGGRLGEVSAQFLPGQITAICGPNGAGKSSLLELLAGLLVPDSGRIEIDGADVAALHPRARARRIGYLPQEPVVAWDVGVRSLVALGRLPHRDRGETQVEAALAMLDLDSLALRPMSRLSGGERARALLARVVAGEPEWLLADEPLAALDLRHRFELLGHLRTLAGQGAAQGTGVVMVVHDLDLARNHADHVVVLDRGQLIASGPPEAALTRDSIAQAWQVDGEWHGEAGALSFVVRR